MLIAPELRRKERTDKKAKINSFMEISIGEDKLLPLIVLYTSTVFLILFGFSILWLTKRNSKIKKEQKDKKEQL